MDSFRPRQQASRIENRRPADLSPGYELWWTEMLMYISDLVETSPTVKFNQSLAMVFVNAGPKKASHLL